MEERRPNFWSEVWTQLKATKEDFWKPYDWAKKYVGIDPGAIAAGAFFAGARALQSLFEGAQAEVSTRQEETIARKGYIAPLPQQEAKRLQDQGYRVWQGQDGLWFREKDGRVEVFANKEITARGYLGYLLSLGQTRQAPTRGANKAGVSAQNLTIPLQGEWLPFEAYVGRLRSIRDQVRAAKTPEAEYLSDIVFEHTMWDLAEDNWSKTKAAAEYLGFLVANDPLNLLTFGLAGGANLTGQLALKLGTMAAVRGGEGLSFAADAARVLSLTFRGMDLSNKLAQDFVAIPLTLPAWALMKAARWAFIPVLRPVVEQGKVVWKLAWAKVTDLSERAKLLQALRNFTNMVREFRELDIDPMILLDQNGIPQGEAGYLRFGLFPGQKKQYFTDEDVQNVQLLLQETMTRIFKTPEPYEVRVRPMGKIQVRKQGQVLEAYSFLIVDIPTTENQRVLIETAVKLFTSPPQPGTQAPGTPPSPQPPTPPSPPSSPQPSGAQPSPPPVAQPPSVSPAQITPPTAQAQSYVPRKPKRRRKPPELPPDIQNLSTPPPQGDIPTWHVPGSQDPAQIDQFVSEQEVLDKILFQDPAAGDDALVPPDEIYQLAPEPPEQAPDLLEPAPDLPDQTLPDDIVQVGPGVSPEDIQKLLFQGKIVSLPDSWPPKWETPPDWGPSPASGAPSGPAPSLFEMEGSAFRAKAEPPRSSPWSRITGRESDYFPGSWPPAWETPDQVPSPSSPGTPSGSAPSVFEMEGGAFRAKAEPPESPWARFMRREPEPPAGEQKPAPTGPDQAAPEPPEPPFQKIGEVRGKVEIRGESFRLVLGGMYGDGIRLYGVESETGEVYTYLVPEKEAKEFERRFFERKLIYPSRGVLEAKRLFEASEDRFGPVFSGSFEIGKKSYLVETEPAGPEHVIVRLIDAKDRRKVSVGRLWNDEASFLHALLFLGEEGLIGGIDADIVSLLRFYGIELPKKRVREGLPLFEKAKRAVRKRKGKEKPQDRPLDPTKSVLFQPQDQTPSPPALPSPDRAVQPAPRARFQPFVPESPEPKTFEEFLERARQEIDPHMDLGLAEQILADPLLSVPDGDLIQLEAIAQANKRAFFSRIRPGVGRFFRQDGELRFQKLSDDDYRVLGNLLVRAAFEWRKGNSGPAFDLLRFFGYAPIPTETGLAIPIENAYAAIVLSRNNTDLLGVFRTLLNLIVDFVGKPGLTPGEAMRLSSARRREMQRLFEGKGVPRDLVRIVHGLVERVRELEGQLKRAAREGKEEEVTKAFQELAQLFQRKELEDLAKVPRILSLSKEDIGLYRNIRALGEGILEGFQDEVLTGGFQGQTDLLGYSLVRPEAVEARVVAGADALLFYEWLQYLRAKGDAVPASQLWRVQTQIRQAVSGIGESIARFISAQGRASVNGTSWISKEGNVVVRIRARGRAGEPKGLSDVIASLQWLFGSGELVFVRPEPPLDRSVLTKLRIRPRGEDSLRSVDPESFLKDPRLTPVEEIEATFEIDSGKTLTGLLLLFSQATTPEAQRGLLSVLRLTAARLARDRYLAEQSALQNPIFTEDAFDFTVRALGLEPENARGFTEEEVGRNLVRPEERSSDLTDESGEVIKERGMDPEKERIQGLSILYTGAKDPQRLLEQAPMLPLVESSFLRGQVRKTELPEVLPNGLRTEEFLDVVVQAYLGDPGPLRILAESLGVESESLDGLVVQASGLEGDQARELLRRVADKVFEAERDRYDPVKALRREIGFEEIEMTDEGKLARFPSTLHYGFVSPSRATTPLARPFDNMVLWAGRAIQRIFGLPEAVQSRFPYARALKQAMEGNFDWLARIAQDQGFVLHINQEGKVVLLGDLQGLEVLPEARDLLLRALLLPDSVFTEVERLLKGLRDGLEEWTDYFESADDEIVAAKVEDLADRVMEAVLLRDTSPVEEFLVRIAEEAPDRAEALRRGFQSLFTELAFERSLFEALSPTGDDLVLPTTKDIKEAIERRVEIAASILANRGDLEGARALRQSADLLSRILQDYAETFWERYYLDTLKKLTGEGFEYRLTQIRRKFNDLQGEVAQIIIPVRDPEKGSSWGITPWRGFSRETLEKLLEATVQLDRERKELSIGYFLTRQDELAKAYDAAGELLSKIQDFLQEVRREMAQPFAPFSRFLGFDPDLPDPFDILFGSIPGDKPSLGTILLSFFEPPFPLSGVRSDIRFVEALQQGVDRAFQRLLPFVQEQAWDLFVRFLRDDPDSFRNHLRDLFFRGILSRDWAQSLGGIELGKLPTAPRDRIKFAWQFLFGTSIRDDQAEFLLHSHGSAAPAPQASEQPRKSLREILARRASQKGTLVLRPEEAKTFQEVVKALPQPIRDLVAALYRFQSVQAKIEKRIQDVFSGRNKLFSGEEAEGAVAAVQEQVEVAPDWAPTRIIRELESLLSKARGRKSLHALGSGLASFARTGNPEGLEIALRRFTGKEVRLTKATESAFLVEVGGNPLLVDGDVALLEAPRPGEGYQRLIADFGKILRGLGAHLTPDQFLYLEGKVAWPDRPVAGLVYPVLEKGIAPDELDSFRAQFRKALADGDGLEEGLEALRQKLDEVFGQGVGEDTPVAVRGSTAVYRNRIEDKLFQELVFGFPEHGSEVVLIAPESNVPIARRYRRIVYTDRGPYFEFAPEDLLVPMDQVLERSEQAALGRALLPISFPTAPEILDAHYQIQTVRGIRRGWKRKDLGLDAPARPEGPGDFVRGMVYIRVWQDDPGRKPQLLIGELKDRFEAPQAPVQAAAAKDRPMLLPPDLPKGFTKPQRKTPWIPDGESPIRVAGLVLDEEALAAADKFVLNVRTVRGKEDLERALKRGKVVYVGRDITYKGIKLEDRGFGNPFKLEKDQDNDRARWEVIRKYLDYLLENPSLLEKIRNELSGVYLLDWCTPELCHAHVLSWIANVLSSQEFAKLVAFAKLLAKDDSLRASRPWLVSYSELDIPVVYRGQKIESLFNLFDYLLLEEAGEAEKLDVVLSPGTWTDILRRLVRRLDPDSLDEQQRLETMRKVLELLLQQSDEFREILLQSEGLPIVFLGYDDFWDYSGQNRLGKLLEEIREKKLKAALGQPATKAGPRPGALLVDFRDFLFQGPLEYDNHKFSNAHHLYSYLLLEGTGREEEIARLPIPLGFEKRALEILEELNLSPSQDRLLRAMRKTLEVLLEQDQKFREFLKQSGNRPIAVEAEGKFWSYTGDNWLGKLLEELREKKRGELGIAPTATAVAPPPSSPEPVDWDEAPFGRLSPEEREAWEKEILDLLFDPVKVPGSSERVKRIAEIGIQKLDDGTEVEVMSPLSVLEYLYFNSPSFRNLVREHPIWVEEALAKLEPHRQGWIEAWNTFRAQYFVLDAIYSLLGPEVAAQYETDFFMRDLSRVLNDAFRVLQFERTTEAWDRNLGYRVALESGDIPEEFMLSPMNYQPLLELQDILKKGSSIGYDLPPALDPVYAKLTRIFFDYAPELRQARESLVEVVERIYREGLGELALALSEAGVVLRGDEASRQAVEEAARRIYRTIAEACRLKGEPLA